MNIINVAYDKSEKDMSAITCFAQKDNGTIDMRVAYVGDKADILYKLVTEQGYLDKILKI